MNLVCCVCHTKVRYLGDYSAVWQVCMLCHEEAGRYARKHDVSMAKAVMTLGQEAAKTRSVERELQDVPKARSRKIKKPYAMDDEGNLLRPARKKRYSKAEYQKLEYDFLNTYVMTFGSEREEIHYLNQLMDVALLGNDIVWARSLHRQLQALKGRMTHGC